MTHKYGSYSHWSYHYFSEYKLLTTNLSATIKELEACESYVFAVGVNGDYGAGPLSQPVTVFTHFNQQAAPKKVKVTPTDNLNSIIISWSASCPNIDEPIRYTVIKKFLNFYFFNINF